jgi:uncharacterized membrane protein YcaP (DUF421 family)
MGKREIGQLSISDLTISILIAELVAISIENRSDKIILTVLPILVLVFFEVFLAYIQLKFNSLRTIMDGKPSVIINKGKLNIKEMIKQRYSMDDLLLQLRSNSIANIKDVNYAVLENNGKLSIFRESDKIDSPLPIIIDGVINMEVLLDINKSLKWLEDSLSNEGINLKDILYAFYNKKKLYIIKK